MDAVISIIFVAIFAFSVFIFFFSRWLFEKAEENPRHSVYYFRECEWYIHPRTFSDRIARRLIHSPRFIQLADYCNTTAFGLFFFFGIAFVLFLFFL